MDKTSPVLKNIIIPRDLNITAYNLSHSDSLQTSKRANSKGGTMMFFNTGEVLSIVPVHEQVGEAMESDQSHTQSQ